MRTISQTADCFATDGIPQGLFDRRWKAWPWTAEPCPPLAQAPCGRLWGQTRDRRQDFYGIENILRIEAALTARMASMAAAPNSP